MPWSSPGEQGLQDLVADCLLGLAAKRRYATAHYDTEVHRYLEDGIDHCIRHGQRSHAPLLPRRASAGRSSIQGLWDRSDRLRDAGAPCYGRSPRFLASCRSSARARSRPPAATRTRAAAPGGASSSPSGPESCYASRPSRRPAPRSHGSLGKPDRDRCTDTPAASSSRQRSSRTKRSRAQLAPLAAPRRSVAEPRLDEPAAPQRLELARRLERSRRKPGVGCGAPTTRHSRSARATTRPSRSSRRTRNCTATRRSVQLPPSPLRRLRELGARDVPQRPTGHRREANPAALTGREIEVLRLLAEGLRNAEIAERLFLSPRTVDNHVSAILRKLHASRRGHAAQQPPRLGPARKTGSADPPI